MKLTMLALSLPVAFGAGCTSVPPAASVAMSELPNCFDANYDKERGLFTMQNVAGNPVNQQCLLRVVARGSAASPQRLTAGSYRVYLSNGGGGGAGGTLQGFMSGGGGGGGGGAGSKETQATVNLTEGVYKLTIGAGGAGGEVCIPGLGFGGGPGWLGSPSNMIRVASGELIIGTAGADQYVRPTRSQNDRMASKADASNVKMGGTADPGHGGAGPGQTSGGHGATADIKNVEGVDATSGASKKLASGRVEPGGATGTISAADKNPGVGGGGGATTIGVGGGGGGESPGQKEHPPERGTLGSGGGGGEGSLSGCDPGARGGNGYIALRPI